MSFAIIVYGSWLYSVLPSGELDTGDWIDRARRFDERDDAEKFVGLELGHIQDQGAVAVVEVSTRADRGHDGVGAM